jgi:hypothetical protein
VAVAAIDILGIGQCQRQRSAAALARKELCVAHTALIDRAAQSIFDLAMSYNVGKTHCLLVYLFLSSEW